MIDEVVEVSDYLNGKNISDLNLYRICVLLAKWYKEQGMGRLDIKKYIYDWAKKNKMHIRHSLNKIIDGVLESGEDLKRNVIVKISKEDIDAIKLKVDFKTARFVALALLCYAKAYADTNKCFKLTVTSLASWLGISPSRLSYRYLNELYNYEYIYKIPLKIDKGVHKTQNINGHFKINADLQNEGEYELINNDIKALYNRCFAKEK